jgi:hypothetical protein
MEAVSPNWLWRKFHQSRNERSMAQFLQSGYKLTWRAGAIAVQANLEPRILSRYTKLARRHLRSIAVQSLIGAWRFIRVQDLNGEQMRVSGCKCFILNFIESSKLQKLCPNKWPLLSVLAVGTIIYPVCRICLEEIIFFLKIRLHSFKQAFARSVTDMKDKAMIKFMFNKDQPVIVTWFLKDFVNNYWFWQRFRLNAGAMAYAQCRGTKLDRSQKFCLGARILMVADERIRV